MTTEKYIPITRSEALPQFAAVIGGSLLVGVLYLFMPGGLVFGPNWLPLLAIILFDMPALGLVLLTDAGPLHRFIRPVTIILLGLLTLTLIASISLLVSQLAYIHQGATLLKPAVLLWVINIAIFAIWYWEVDGDGLVGRHRRRHEAADFQFPQQEGGNTTGWVPAYIDYLFLAFNTATALSPTDTMPLTRRVKLLMMAESVGSMLILFMLIARSINIIG